MTHFLARGRCFVARTSVCGPRETRRKGLIAAHHILGLQSRDDVLSPPDGSLRIYPSEQPETWLPQVQWAKAPRRRDPEVTGHAADAC